MKTIEIIPNAYLIDFIEKIYVNFSDNYYFRGITEPFLQAELFISSGDYFQIGKDKFSKSFPTPIAFFGTRSTSVPIKTYGNHFTAGIIFKPWGLYSIFGIEGKSITNQSLIIENYPEFREFVNDITFKNIEPEKMIEKLELTISKLILNCRINANFQKSFDLVDSLPLENANLDEVASKVNLSKKSVIQLFNLHLGISPMKYIQIKTIIEALKYIKKGRNINFTSLAHEMGFYDQAHFIKVFKSCMAITPSEYMKYLKKVNSIQF